MAKWIIDGHHGLALADQVNLKGVVPYEVEMAAREARDAVEAWTNARKDYDPMIVLFEEEGGDLLAAAICPTRASAHELYSKIEEITNDNPSLGVVITTPDKPEHMIQEAEAMS